MRATLAVCSCLISCGDNASSQCPDGETLVTVPGAWSYASARVRTDGGLWREITNESFCAADDYDLSFVCDLEIGPTYATQYLGSVGDNERLWFGTCGGQGGFLVTGELNQAATVEIGGDFAMATEAPWRFRLLVPPTEYTLFVSTSSFGADIEPPRVAIRRGITVSGDMDLGAIDLAMEGFDTASATITTTGKTPGDSFFIDVGVHLKNTAASVSNTADGDTAYLIPASMLAAGEQQYISVSSYGERFTRSVDITSPMEVAALPPEWQTAMLTASPSGFEASWTSLAFGSGSVFLYEQSNEFLRAVNVSPSRGVDIERIRFDDTVDGLGWGPFSSAGVGQEGVVNGQLVWTLLSSPLTGSSPGELERSFDNRWARVGTSLRFVAFTARPTWD